MNLSLQELGKEYEKSISIQKGVIEKNRKRLLTAQQKGNYKEIKRLNCLLRVLYEEKSELEERAHQLQQHYT